MLIDTEMHVLAISLEKLLELCHVKLEEVMKVLSTYNLTWWEGKQNVQMLSVISRQDSFSLTLDV